MHQDKAIAFEDAKIHPLKKKSIKNRSKSKHPRSSTRISPIYGFFSAFLPFSRNFGCIIFHVAVNSYFTLSARLTTVFLGPVLIEKGLMTPASPLITSAT